MHVDEQAARSSWVTLRRGGAALLAMLIGSAWSLAQVPGAAPVPPPAMPPVAPVAPPTVPVAPPVTQPVQPAGFRSDVPGARSYANPGVGTPPAAPAAPATPAAVDPMDYPLRLIGDAQQAFRGVRDYTCVFIKQEQIGGRIQPENVMSMKVRQQPFSVNLRWLNPKDLAGQEVAYVAGQNNGALRVHATGIRGAVGFVSLQPNDPRVTSQSRHSITEAGVGNLIDQLQRNWAKERGLARSQVRAAEYEYARRKCIRVEIVHASDEVSRQFYSYRSVIFFDKETRLPIRAEAYDWPRRGGPADGDLLESYSYVDFHFNVGLNDETFRR
jgi:hypothetical protein